MASLNRLQTRLDRIHVVIEQEQDRHIEERIQVWTRESLFRKLEAFFKHSNGDSARYHYLAQEIDQDIEGRKSEEEKQAEQRYKLKYPCTGAKEALMRKLARSMPSCDL